MRLTLNDTNLDNLLHAVGKYLPETSTIEGRGRYINCDIPSRDSMPRLEFLIPSCLRPMFAFNRML
jgi:hypothetical protein